jgi:microcin C transport system ATP-binding protein
MSKEVLVNVKNLSVAFSAGGVTTTAVKGVSFRINKGETVALVGESGSGKSVSALSILRLLPYPAASHPTGQIFFEGKDLLAASEEELKRVRGDRISMIFQEPMTSLNPLHTIERQVGEMIYLHQGLRGAAARARVLELLTKVGIPEPEKRLDAFPHQLSGGQRQRVMIAMALANEPDLLIADEPTTALDVTIQAQILELLRNLQREMGMAMLLITHDLGIVRRMAERVYVMQKGLIVEEQATEKLFTAPQHPYTRHLLAAEPKGKPPQLRCRCPRGGRDAGPQGLVSDQARVPAADRGSREGRRRPLGQDSQGANRGCGGRIRIRQDDARPCHPAADLVRGTDRLHGEAHRRAELEGDAPAPA